MGDMLLGEGGYVFSRGLFFCLILCNSELKQKVSFVILRNLFQSSIIKVEPFIMDIIRISKINRRNYIAFSTI